MHRAREEIECARPRVGAYLGASIASDLGARPFLLRRVVVEILSPLVDYRDGPRASGDSFRGDAQSLPARKVRAPEEKQSGGQHASKEDSICIGRGGESSEEFLRGICSPRTVRRQRRLMSRSVSSSYVLAIECPLGGAWRAARGCERGARRARRGRERGAARRAREVRGGPRPAGSYGNSLPPPDTSSAPTTCKIHVDSATLDYPKAPPRKFSCAPCQRGCSDDLARTLREIELFGDICRPPPGYESASELGKAVARRRARDVEGRRKIERRRSESGASEEDDRTTSTSGLVPPRAVSGGKSFFSESEHGGAHYPTTLSEPKLNAQRVPHPSLGSQYWFAGAAAAHGFWRMWTEIEREECAGRGGTPARRPEHSAPPLPPLPPLSSPSRAMTIAAAASAAATTDGHRKERLAASRSAESSRARLRSGSKVAARLRAFPLRAAVERSGDVSWRVALSDRDSRGII
ncbi:hypothetical protein KM043_003790 [Ampulex compressa]|nr:hypothetical protein KM043_003790 [Ampulex compressa]